MSAPPDLSSVPVQLEPAVSDVLQGFFDIDGLLRLDEDTLVFEYRRSGLRSAEVDVARIALADVESFSLDRGWLGWKLRLRPRRLVVLENLPGETDRALVLGVRRADRSLAEQLVGHVQHRLARHRGQAPASIPFRLPKANHGLRDVRGTVYLDEAFLVLEVQSSVPGGVARENQVVKVEPGAFASVHLERGRRHDVLHLRPRKSQLLEVMPGQHAGALALRIKARDRMAAEHLVYELEVQRKAAALNRAERASTDDATPDEDASRTGR